MDEKKKITMVPVDEHYMKDLKVLASVRATTFFIWMLSLTLSIATFAQPTQMPWMTYLLGFVTGSAGLLLICSDTIRKAIQPRMTKDGKTFIVNSGK